MEPYAYFYIKKHTGQDASWAFLALGSLLTTSIGNAINMNSLHSWPKLTGQHSPHCPTPASDRPSESDRQDFRQSLSPCDRPYSGSVFRPCDHPPLPQRKTPSLRRESAKRSACSHLSNVSKRLARPGRTLQRYDLGVLWGLWLRVAVQNIIRNSPQRMPCGKRSCILYSPTPAAGAVA
jgi:hypothetical protein